MQGIAKILLKYYLPTMAVIAFLASVGFYEHNRKSVLWSDAEGYYMYLPAVFIYQGFEEIRKDIAVAENVQLKDVLTCYLWRAGSKVEAATYIDDLNLTVLE